MSLLKQNIKNRIDSKWKELNSLRPLPSSAVKKLREQFSIEMTYNSNAIEGNQLSLRETYLVINEGITVKGVPLKDHLEAKDHHEAMKFLYEFCDNTTKNTFSENLIRNLHQLVVSKTEKDAGRYRAENVFILGSDHKPPNAFEVTRLMSELAKWIKINFNKLHPVELAAIIHHRFVYIHPFIDGNGRTARLLMNLILLQKKFPLVVILKNDRKKYYRVLDLADKGKLEPLVQFISQSVERSLDIYLKTLKPSNNKQDKMLLLSEVSKFTTYSTKYLNLLIRQGKLEAIKEGRNWKTSVTYIKKYEASKIRKRKK